MTLAALIKQVKTAIERPDDFDEQKKAGMMYLSALGIFAFESTIDTFEEYIPLRENLSIEVTPQYMANNPSTLSALAEVYRSVGHWARDEYQADVVVIKDISATEKSAKIVASYYQRK